MKNRRFFTYRYSYYFTHPIKFFEDIFYQVKWAYQRVFRGWDDLMLIRGLDYFIVENIEDWVKTIKECKEGIPVVFFNNGDWDNETGEISDEDHEIGRARYFKVLDEIVEGFKNYEFATDHCYYRVAYKEGRITPLEYAKWLQSVRLYNRGMELFVKYIYVISN